MEKIGLDVCRGNAVVHTFDEAREWLGPDRPALLLSAQVLPWAEVARHRLQPR